MMQKSTYTDSGLKSIFQKGSFFKDCWGEYFRNCPSLPLINSLERFIQNYVPKKIPLKITFMQSGTNSEAAAGAWETHIF